MLDAILTDDSLEAPTVGVFRTTLTSGSALVAGAVLGTISRLGKSIPVLAPPETEGAAVEIGASGTWVAYGDRLVALGDAQLSSSAPAARRALETGVPEGTTAVRADTDGTIYLRPEPGAAVFAEPGALVADRATLALVEVMKTFSPVRTPHAGRLTKVCVRDGASVEAGAVLFWVEPD